MKLLLILVSLFSLPPAYSKFTPGLGDLSCGQEGQKKCNFFNKEFWLTGSGGCDRGLRSKKGTCQVKKRNSLKDYKWIAKTLKFQRELQKDLPINQISLLAPHNSFNNKKDGYLFPNQIYSITDQFEMGARMVDLDVHWFAGQLRLCHGSNKHLLCSPFDRPYFNGIEEINLWLRKKENKDEVIIIDYEKKYGDKEEFAVLALEHHFGNLLLTHDDFDSNIKWPSLTELRKMGKRVITVDGPGRYNIKIEKRPGNPDYYIKNFRGKTCEFLKNGEPFLLLDPTFANGAATYWVELGADSTRYWFFYDGAKKTGVFTPEVVKAATECNIAAMSPEQLDPPMAAAAIWTWAKGEPIDWNKSGRCAQIDKTGSWHSRPCSKIYPFACQNNSNPGLWKVTSYRGTHNEGVKACKWEFTNYNFAHPMNGWQNARLYKNHSKSA